ncbi:hypothetical protein KY289_036784 [Solanum tuberosum]|nr:hypothetical protein KY289_036784 [Solanum tuberosum]
MAQTFSMLVPDEKQREIKPNNQLFMDSTSLNASRSGKMIMESTSFNVNGSGGVSTSRSPRQNYSSTGNNTFRASYSQATTYNGNKLRVVCDYCKKPDHTKDKCYKFNGYSQAPSMKKPLEIGAKDRLYFLCSKCLKNNNNSDTKYVSSDVSKVPAHISSTSAPTYKSFPAFSCNCKNTMPSTFHYI